MKYLKYNQINKIKKNWVIFRRLCNNNFKFVHILDPCVYSQSTSKSFLSKLQLFCCILSAQSSNAFLGHSFIISATWIKLKHESLRAHRQSAVSLFYETACHVTLVHLCWRTEDFSGDTVVDHKLLCHWPSMLSSPRAWQSMWTYQIGVKYLKLLTYLAK